MTNRMGKIRISIAYNGEWSPDNKYLNHETKLLLVSDGITFEGLVEKIFQVLKLKGRMLVSSIWFETKLETSKGMLVTDDEEVNTCLYLLRYDSNFLLSRFIVDLVEHNSLLASCSNKKGCAEREEVNVVQQEEGEKGMYIERYEGSVVVEPKMEVAVTVPNERIEEAEHLSNGKRGRKKSSKLRKDMIIMVLRENASLDEIGVGSTFANKESLKKCFANNAIKHKFKFKVFRSTKVRYCLRCYNKDCNWYMHAVKDGDSALFRINKLCKKHSCSAEVFECDQQRHATANVICGYILELLDESEADITPKFVVEEMRKKYGLSISYHKAWRAIQRALRLTGSASMCDEEASEQLEYSCRNNNFSSKVVEQSLNHKEQKTLDRT